ncbi:MAG: hypothetical protein AAGG07_11690 [Planctomycetota bacterium]
MTRSHRLAAAAASILLAASLPGCLDEDKGDIAIGEASALLQQLASEQGSLPPDGYAEQQIYRQVISTLQGAQSELDGDRKAAAALLTAKAQTGLGKIAASRALDQSRRVVDAVIAARGSLDGAVEAAAFADAAGSYRAADDLAEARAGIAKREREIETVKQARAQIEARVAEIRAEADANLDAARSVRDQEAALRLRLPEASPGEAERLLREARVFGREADALESEAERLRAEADSIAPEIAERGLDVGRLEGQIASLERAMEHAQAREEAGKAESASARQRASELADVFAQQVTEARRIASEDLAPAYDEAIQTLSSARSTAGQARSAMRKQSSAAQGLASERAAALHRSAATAHAELARLLDAAGEAGTAVGDAAGFASMATEQQAEADRIAGAAAEADREATDALVSAGAREPDPEPFDQGGDETFDSSGEEG